MYKHLWASLLLLGLPENRIEKSLRYFLIFLEKIQRKIGRKTWICVYHVFFFLRFLWQSKWWKLLIHIGIESLCWVSLLSWHSKDLLHLRIIQNGNESECAFSPKITHYNALHKYCALFSFFNLCFGTGIDSHIFSCTKKSAFAKSCMLNSNSIV